MTAARTITLPTADGPVTLTCPEWCAGHADHRPDTARVDLTHVGPAVRCTFHGIEVSLAELVASPYASPGNPELGGRTPGVSVDVLGRTLDPVQVYGFAAALDRYSDQLRTLADQLTVILDGSSE